MALKGLLLSFLLQIVFDAMLRAATDEAMNKSMAQGRRYLGEQVMALLQGLEQGASAWAAPLLPALQLWHCWALALAALILVLGLCCCWLRTRGRQPARSSEEGTVTAKAHLDDAQDNTIALEGHRVLAQRHLDLSKSFIEVEELVDELLQMCRKLSRNSFVPQLRPVVGVSCKLRGWSSCEEDAIFVLLVPLKPPRGHAFHVEMGTSTTTKDMPKTKSCLRVDLQCTCTREQLDGDMMCLLHHPEKALRGNQGPSLLGTLCTGPYLDMEKTARWLQGLLQRAWTALPQAKHCRLKVLPSRNSCPLQLTSAEGSVARIELMLGVKEGDSYLFLG